jgi:hypothetical protein
VPVGVAATVVTTISVVDTIVVEDSHLRPAKKTS